ncbi:type II toxin-antitoxin system VapC family toxin [Microbacterium sp. X-17]|uniref:type II toxin-antitoxin system VapC family toxin n=1 Tax=Microbacterium sp. X-17 TaxID=3144404 RepID=UPI0031F57BD3
MILVDTSIWIDHLHRADSTLTSLLESDEVGTHPLVIEELALGSLARRSVVLELIASLRRFPILRHDELLALVERRRLWGLGLSATDAHLLGSVALVPGARIWTRDKRLAAACTSAGITLGPAV